MSSQELPHKFDTRNMLYVENVLNNGKDLFNFVSELTLVLTAKKDGWYRASVEFQLIDGHVTAVQNFLVLTDSYVSASKNKPPPGPESKEPVHMDDRGWWYWCSNWEDREGPFSSKCQAEDAYNYYCMLPDQSQESESHTTGG